MTEATELVAGLLESPVRRFCADNEPTPQTVDYLAARYDDLGQGPIGVITTIESGRGELAPQEVQERLTEVAQESAESVAAVMDEEEDWAARLARKAAEIADDESGALSESPTKDQLLRREARILEMFVDEVLPD
ncbi:hypothetical protein [Streptomyces sp. NPDC047028]|uniref:hypothetical protein n=1 Tax=Streptomyces sp. NPDC047028 TaxID=3155793 RepID=UPI0033FC8B73